jgi:hypothetical protein
MAESKKFSVRTDGGGQNVFVTDVFLLSVPEEVRPKALSINDDGRVVLTTMSGGGGTTDTGSLLANASVNSNTLTFTRGDSTTFDLTVNTGSGGGSTDTGSLLTTASVSLNTITFTKGDASTFNIIVNTGSDQFTGTVTSVGGTGTVNGITLSGTVTTSGNLTLGGSVSINNSNWSGTNLSVANGGTGASSFTSNALLTGNGTSAIQAESNLTFNGSTLAVTGNVTATSFTGSLLGTATTASVATSITAVANNTTNETTYITFVDGATGTQGIETDTGLTYNPSTNTLSTLNFNGNAATATIATTATTAITATNATLSETSSTVNTTLEASADKSFYPTFIDIGGGGNGKTLYYDNSTFSYNPSSDTLTVANLAGTATSANTATNATNATNATTASTVTVTNTTTGTGPYYLTFSSGISGAQILRTDSLTLTFNATTNTLTVANLTGTASVATNIAVTDAGGDTSTYVLLAGSQTGNQGAKTDAGLTYNATTNALTATSFLGTATSATSANSATSASYAENTTSASFALTSSTINVTLVSENFTYYPTFIYKGEGEGGENGRTLYYDDSTFSYNSSTDTLTVTSSYALTASYLEGGGGGSYTLPSATSTVLGGIKLEDDTVQTVGASGITSTAGRTYGLQVNASGQGVVNVPWVNTTYATATNTTSGLLRLYSNTVQSVAPITVTSTAGRTYGLQLNGGSQGVVNVPWVDTTYTSGDGLDLDGTEFAFDGLTSTLPSRTYKPVGESQTTNTSTSTLSAGYLYPLDATGGTITITLNASTQGYEFDFFVTNLDNEIDFVADAGQTVISENGLKANSTGSAITAKALDGTTWALVGSLKV